MNDDQLLRYSRQIMLPDFDIEGQQALLDSHVLIIGLGGLGSPVAMYLAAAGIGRLTLVDDDVVDLSNLQRQIVHATASIGTPKVESARTRLLELNPDCDIHTIHARLTDQALDDAVIAADLVIDASDNFTSRFMINDSCVRTQTPLVSGAGIRMEGQVSVFRADLADSPCYRCLYKDEGDQEELCSENGVLAPLVGIIGSIQAMEAIKVLTGTGECLTGKLMILDGKYMEWRTLKLKKDPGCPVCGG